MGDVKVFVGCCGFPFSRKKYYALFNTVEVQQTFYKLPQKSTLERWRKEAPSSFVFNIKAWQVITHPASSPTWRRAGIKPIGNIENYGYLKPTKENIDAWIKTIEAARILGARVIVLQTPPSFSYSETNVKNAKEFFMLAARYTSDRIVIGWEPRGDWHEHRDMLEDIMCGVGVIHVVDPFRRKPVVCSGQKILYLRLHGIGGREVNYKYKYTDEDLRRLVWIVRGYIDEYTFKEVYIMFNNVYMGEDAQRFRDIARAEGLEVL